MIYRVNHEIQDFELLGKIGLKMFFLPERWQGPSKKKLVRFYQELAVS